MNGSVAPANVTVKVKLSTVIDPGRICGVQFGLGQVCGAAVNGFTVSDGIVSLPFFGESVPLLVEAVNVVVWDSTGLFGFTPGLKQSIVAEKVALRSAVAFVLPTPAISNELHVTEEFAPTVQLGVGVPVTRCAPFGPFAADSVPDVARRSPLGLVVVSVQATTAKAIRDSAVNRFMVCLLGMTSLQWLRTARLLTTKGFGPWAPR
jgi:hypothetical protein